MNFRHVRFGLHALANVLPFLCAALLIVMPGQPLEAFAAEQAKQVDEQYERVIEEPGKIGALEKKVEEVITRRSLSETLDLHLYGYVDVSYLKNFGNPSDGTNQLRAFDVDSDAFRVHMAQIVLEKQGKTGGELIDHAGFRVKLDFGEDSQFTGGSDFQDEVDFQEVYAQFVAPFGNGVDLRMGRQNTLIGFEVIESPYNPNFSRSWLFGIGQPFTTTGIRAAYDLNDKISFAIGAISSFTQAPGDTNAAPSVESAVSATLTDQLSMTGYFFWGEEGPRNSSLTQAITMGGGIINFRATEHTTFIVEGYYANQANVSPITAAGNGRWNGLAGYLIHDFSDQWGFRVRGEIFEDAGATRACLGAIGTPGAPNTPPLPKANVCFTPTGIGSRNIPGTGAGIGPTAQTLWEMTYTLLFKPVPSLMTRLEYRYDKSNKNTFEVGGRSANYQNTLALEAIYLF